MLLALGLFAPLGSLGVAAAMLMAMVKVHWPKVWVTQNGMELTLTNLAATIAVAIAGPGAYSLDAVVGTALSPGLAIAAVVVVLAGWIAGFVISSGARRQVPRESAKRAA